MGRLALRIAGSGLGASRKVDPFRVSFGLLTVTHSRNGDYSVLEKYINLYTQTECYQDLIS